MRGLKLAHADDFVDDLESHPSRVRGLKQTTRYVEQSDYAVAPLAGAWIETLICFPPLQIDFVAPLAGAWIETVMVECSPAWESWSHPSRVRGLKLTLMLAAAIIGGRTPRGCVD